MASEFQAVQVGKAALPTGEGSAPVGAVGYFCVVQVHDSRLFLSTANSRPVFLMGQDRRMVHRTISIKNTLKVN
jgi:hypothetical protein